MFLKVLFEKNTNQKVTLILGFDCSFSFSDKKPYPSRNLKRYGYVLITFVDAEVQSDIFNDNFFCAHIWVRKSHLWTVS